MKIIIDVQLSHAEDTLLRRDDVVKAIIAAFNKLLNALTKKA